MNLIIILTILITHYIADFVFQDDNIAQNKWKSFNALFEHVCNYTCICAIPFIFGMFFTGDINVYIKSMGLFLLTTFIFHITTDYFTSKINHKLAKETLINNNWHNFFLSVGFDQLLHYVQLFITYNLLFNPQT